MQILFDLNKTPLVPVKPYEAGFVKVAKVVPYVLVAGLATWLSTVILPNWHPSTALAAAVFAVINLVLVQVTSWADAHAQIKQAQQGTTPATPPAPTTPETPPTPPAA
jgi:hypothetical protein